MTLKYLFKVEFTDGTTFSQNKEDVSASDPKRNAFYDVAKSGKTIKTFTLSHFLERYSIDLTTGIFKINGVDMHPEPIVGRDGKEKVVRIRELVRYMKVKKRFNATYTTKTGNMKDIAEVSEERVFYFGFETEIDGEIYTRVLGVK